MNDKLQSSSLEQSSDSKLQSGPATQKQGLTTGSKAKEARDKNEEDA